MINLDRNALISYLEDNSPEVAATLYSEAYKVKKKTVGESVYLRGLVEISNICRKNCLYCGIRRDNLNTGRYELTS